MRTFFNTLGLIIFFLLWAYPVFAVASLWFFVDPPMALGEKVMYSILVMIYSIPFVFFMLNIFRDQSS